MIADDYDAKFEEYERTKDRMPERFESPEAISKHLLDVNDYASNAVNQDSARANLNPLEMREARSKGNLIIELEEAQQICGWDLENQKAKQFGKLGVLNVTSRAKQGWASVLSKTDKHINIQQAEQYANNISDEFDERVSQSVGDKIGSKLPFLKKRGI